MAPTDLLQTLIKDGEQFADHELPSLNDVARMFKPLVARLEAEIPALADRELSSLIGSSAAPAAIEQPPAAAGAATSIQTQPAGAPTQVAPDLTPQQRAAQLRAEADALDPEAPVSETPAQRLRREADAAEAEEIQAQARAGTAAGADAGSVVKDGEAARSAQVSS